MEIYKFNFPVMQIKLQQIFLPAILHNIIYQFPDSYVTVTKCTPYPHFAIPFTEGWIKRNAKLCATRHVKYNDSSFTVRAVYLRAQYPGFITKQHIGIDVKKKWVYVLFVTSFPTITIPGFNVTNQRLSRDRLERAI